MKRIYVFGFMMSCLGLSAWAQSDLLMKERVQQIGLLETCQELSQRKVKRAPVVALIDTGVDTTSVSVYESLWNNPKETADGIDNDGNGFVDDLHGWNFLGAADGSWNMTRAGTEEFREFKRLYPKFKESQDTTSQEYHYYMRMRRKAGIDSYLKYYDYMKLKNQAYVWLDSIQTADYGEAKDTLTLAFLSAGDADEQKVNLVFSILAADLLQQNNSSRWIDAFEKHMKEFNLVRQRIGGIERDPDKRTLLGDNYSDIGDRSYGNPCLMVDGYEQGTFAAALIAGNPKGGLPGICPEARLMILRAVPEGDEYDKDVAMAIRYAVEQGADIINLNLGKYVSPNAEWVDEALAYAEKKGVLVIHAAGNKGLNLDSMAIYPTGLDKKGRIRNNFLRVGAVSEEGGRASFSNYGSSVEIYAPGEGVVSLVGQNQWETSSGTSVSAPVVTGVAALIKAYYPKMKAKDLKQILIQSADQREEDASLRVLNAYRALKQIRNK